MNLLKVKRFFLSNKLGLFGALVLITAFLVAIFAPYIAPQDPFSMDFGSMFAPPSLERPFGADSYGRDILTRVIYGARISIFVGLMTTLLTTLLGASLGLMSGFYKKFDNLIMRVMDSLMAFPAILLGISIVAVRGPSVWNVILALTIVYTPRTARVVRSSVLSIKEEVYVEAAKALGTNNFIIMFRHIFPNTISPLIVQQTIILAYAILAEAGLSFLGAGAPPPTPSWGNILSEGRDHLYTAPWITLFPGLAIVFVVLGINILGDRLRDVLDPKVSTSTTGG